MMKLVWVESVAVTVVRGFLKAMVGMNDLEFVNEDALLQKGKTAMKLVAPDWLDGLRSTQV